MPDGDQPPAADSHPADARQTTFLSVVLIHFLPGPPLKLSGHFWIGRNRHANAVASGCTHSNKAAVAAAAAHCHWLQGEPPAAPQELIDVIELLFFLVFFRGACFAYRRNIESPCFFLSIFIYPIKSQHAAAPSEPAAVRPPIK